MPVIRCDNAYRVDIGIIQDPPEITVCIRFQILLLVLLYNVVQMIRVTVTQRGHSNSVDLVEILYILAAFAANLYKRSQADCPDADGVICTQDRR